MRTFAIHLVAALLVGGCGVADTATATATVAAAKKKELEQARAIQQQLQQDLDASMRARREQLEQMERASR